MGKGRGRKQARWQKEPPGDAKTPRINATAQSFYDERPSWRLGTLDVGGPYCFSSIGREQIFSGEPPSAPGQVLGRLRAFESMTWREIIGGKSHPIPVTDLSREAQKRLADLQLDDVDQVMSLRVTGAQRIFGVRLGSVLELLWWDPEHSVCPSSVFE